LERVRLQRQLGALYAQGKQAWETGQKSEALAAFEQIMDLDPNFRDVANQLQRTRAVAG
jgi:hypothetical protein